jgi:hypothetical protein
MMILYTCDNEGPAVMSLNTLLRNFETTQALEKHLTPAEIRYELESRGWFEGLHDNGRYLILNMERVAQHIIPTETATAHYRTSIGA